MEAVDFRIEVGDRLDGGYRLTVRSEDDEFQGVASWSYSRSDMFFWRHAQTGYVNRLATREDVAEFPTPYRGAGRKPPVFSKSGRYLAVPTSSSTVEIWDLTPGAPTPASADPAPDPGA